jgi:hypothetical protein
LAAQGASASQDAAALASGATAVMAAAIAIRMDQQRKIIVFP